MRENKNHVTPMQLIPLYFDQFDEEGGEDSGEIVDDAEVKRMRDEMRRINEEYERTHATD